jgi:hypothetical protein
MEVWRTALNEDEHYSFAIPIALSPTQDQISAATSIIRQVA